MSHTAWKLSPRQSAHMRGKDMTVLIRSASFRTEVKDVGSVPFSVKAEDGLWNNERGILGEEVRVSS